MPYIVHILDDPAYGHDTTDLYLSKLALLITHDDNLQLTPEETWLASVR